MPQSAEDFKIQLIRHELAAAELGLDLSCCLVSHDGTVVRTECSRCIGPHLKLIMSALLRLGVRVCPILLL